jgi:hypothetical protein
VFLRNQDAYDKERAFKREVAIADLELVQLKSQIAQLKHALEQRDAAMSGVKSSIGGLTFQSIHICIFPFVSPTITLFAFQMQSRLTELKHTHGKTPWAKKTTR